jgi:hypothetical protein
MLHELIEPFFSYGYLLTLVRLAPSLSSVLPSLVDYELEKVWTNARKHTEEEAVLRVLLGVHFKVR